MARLFKMLCVCMVVSGVAAALDFSQLPDPTADLRVGQWATYDIMGAQQKQTIISIDGEGDERMLTVVFESSTGDTTDSMQSVVSVADLKSNPADFPEDDTSTMTRETRTIGGKEIEVIVLNINGEDSGSRLVLSQAVPISGIVSMEAAGVGMVMDLVDFGQGEE